MITENPTLIKAFGRARRISRDCVIDGNSLEYIKKKYEEHLANAIGYGEALGKTEETLIEEFNCIIKELLYLGKEVDNNKEPINE